MIIDTTESRAIVFFHVDALRAAASMKMDADVQLTVIASVLYRMSDMRVG